MIERGYLSLVNGLAKLQNKGEGNWVDNLYSILWTDRTTINNTRYTLYYLEYGQDAVLPIDLEFPT